MNVLLFSSLFPNKIHLNQAVFVKHRLFAVRHHYNIRLKVIAPVPFFPPLKTFPRWYRFSQIPIYETMEGVDVYHPRYFVSPRIGMSLYGWWMFLGAYPTARKLHRRVPFDLIDGHYIYPDGFAAVLMGRLFNKPVILSARGTDINLYPKFPIVRSLIRTTLKKSNNVISVCSSLKYLMTEMGIESEKIHVISNGIDPSRFNRMDKVDARKHIGIAPDHKMLLTTGALIERKGIHILIDAIHEIWKKGKLDFITCIVGSGELYHQLDSQIDAYGLKQWVILQGEIPNTELRYWYNAADVFFLGSSREGWPNVVCEALACGIPVVATPVNGVPEIIHTDAYGILVDRNADAFANGIIEAFERQWDYDAIYRYGQSRTWETVAHEVYDLFSTTIHNFKAKQKL